jgi:hypothetical protein
MLLKLIFITLSVISGQIIFIFYLAHVYLRNIFIQKILYLNDVFKDLNSDEIKRFFIGKHIKFRYNIEFEEFNPPTKYSKYLVNESYSKLFAKNEKRIQIFRKVAIVVFYSYTIALSLLFVVYLIMPSSVWSL